MKRDRLRDLLIIDATLIAGLLILLSLYPLEIVITECDFKASAASALRFFFGFIAALALVLFTLSAVISFSSVFGGSELDPHPYQAIRQHRLSYAASTVLTVFGLILLLSIAVGVVFYTYQDSFTADLAGCYTELSADLNLQDEITVTKNETG